MPERLGSKQFKDILRSAPIPIIIVGMEGVILFVNDAVETYFGYARNELIKQLVNVLIPEPALNKSNKRKKNEVAQPMIRPLNSGLNLRARHKNGHEIPVDISLSPVATAMGKSFFTAILHIRNDFTAPAENLYNLIRRDPLTNLFTVDCFKDRLGYAISLVRNTNVLLSVFYIDIDNFKRINDTYGHSVGDKVLKTFSDRLKQSLRTCEVIARFSGDEFGCLITNIARQKDIKVIVARVLESIAEPFFIENLCLSITASIGISFFPNDSHDAAILLEKADLAMYKAKKKGKNCCRYSSKLVPC